MFDFLKKKKRVNLQQVRDGIVIPTFIYQNDNIDIVHRACKICYDMPLCKTYDEKTVYIQKRGAIGHESIFEHSNLVNIYAIDQCLYRELTDVLSASRYVNTKVIFDDVDNVAYLLIGGQIRGYKEIIRSIYNPNNAIAKAIINSLYVTNACYFTDFINDGLMDEDLFNKFDNVDIKYKETTINEYLDIVNIDPVTDIYNGIKEYGFTYEDAIDVSTITIFIKDISRIISQMVTRHDFGITQKSQRYVDYSTVKFNSPYLFKPEKYNKDQSYDIWMNGQKFSVTQDILGEMLMNVYPQLLSQGMIKEDARGYIPQNNQTSLYITSEFKKMFNFLKIRTEQATQAELRISIAAPLDRVIDHIIQDKYQYLEPRYKRYEAELEDEYNDNTEIVLGKEQVSYEKIKDIDELIHEDEDGNLHYSEDDFI